MFKSDTARRRFQLTMVFALVVFAIMLVSMAFVFLVGCVLAWTGVLKEFLRMQTMLVLYCVVSLVVGAVLTAIISRFPLTPIREIVDAADKIADGDYSTRLKVEGLDEFRHLRREFNHMAEELDSVELLRKDFINNFSHEFKTPIVSIQGFAKMLRDNQDLTDEERSEYLNVIIQECERLTRMSSNALMLSKVDQQAILSDCEQFDVSEQLRLAMIQTAEKWMDKDVEFQLEGEEQYIWGNQELLTEVWLNLLDNAVKFSRPGGTVTVTLEKEGDRLKCNVSDQGDPVPPGAAEHIFDQFYQGDTSHTVQGNGLGLAIAEKIVAMHGGQLTLLRSNPEETTFQVVLPVRASALGTDRASANAAVRSA